MSVGADPVFGAVSAQQQRLQGRDDTKENTARWAINAFEFTTTGAGSLVTGVVQFDCNYIEKPVFTTGVEIVQEPDPGQFHLPLSNAMVYGWITAPQEAAATPTTVDATGTSTATDPTATTPVSTDPAAPPKLYWVGAYVAFEVQVKPLENVSADPADAYAVLLHHLCFNGLAMKKLSPSVTDSQDDATVPSRDLGFAVPGA